VPLAYFARCSSLEQAGGALRTLFLIPWCWRIVTPSSSRLMNPSSGPVTLALKEIFGHPVYLTLTEGGGGC
jgi:hypothetical protein